MLLATPISLAKVKDTLGLKVADPVFMHILTSQESYISYTLKTALHNGLSYEDDVCHASLKHLPPGDSSNLFYSRASQGDEKEVTNILKVSCVFNSDPI